MKQIKIPNRLSRYAVWLSALCFTASLLLPAYTIDYYGTLKPEFGFSAFLLGPIGLFAGHFSWLANLFLFFSWSKRTGPRSQEAVALAVVGLLIAVTFLVPENIAYGSAGEFSYTAAMGYYTWLASIGLAAIAAYLYREPAPV